MFGVRVCGIGCTYTHERCVFVCTLEREEALLAICLLLMSVHDRYVVYKKAKSRGLYVRVRD